jgi:arylsulfatase A-like enzyme
MGLRLTMAAALATVGACGGCGGGQGPRPDVVLIVLDTLRADRLSCYGYGRDTSPFLDRLAEEGALFEDVTCQFSWTRPSMVSMFHGRYLTAYRDALEPGAPVLAELFQEAGYRTYGFIANQLINPNGAFERGFDHFDAPPPAHSPERRDNAHWPRLSELLERAWSELDALPGEAARPPLLLYFHVMDTHDPYEAHAELNGALPPTGAEPVWPEGWQRAELADRGAVAPAGSWDPELNAIRRARGHYDQGVLDLSHQLEELFAGLERRGLLENAVVAVVSDHGEGLWEHVAPLPDEDLATAEPWEFFYQKHGASQYQEVLATPMLLWGAGVPAGARTTRAVENVDLVPTLLELVDLPAPDGLHGRSLVPLMAGEDPAWREFVFSYGVHGNSVREVASGLKLILPLGNTLRAGHGPELYDLGHDPHERDNLASERPEDVRRLTAAWLEWRERHPTEDNLRAAARRQADKDYARLLQSLGYTELDTGLEADTDAPAGED